MSIEKRNVIEVSSLSGIPALEIKWAKPADPDTAYRIYEEVLQEMKQRNIKHLVLDIRKKGEASSEDEDWLYTEFIPRLISFFGSDINLAYVLNISHYTHMLGEGGKPENLENHSELLRINYFTTRKEAINWITDKLAA